MDKTRLDQQSTKSGSNKSHREQEVQGWYVVMYTTFTYITSGIFLEKSIGGGGQIGIS